MRLWLSYASKLFSLPNYSHNVVNYWNEQISFEMTYFKMESTFTSEYSSILNSKVNDLIKVLIYVQGNIKRSSLCTLTWIFYKAKLAFKVFKFSQDPLQNHIRFALFLYGSFRKTVISTRLCCKFYIGNNISHWLLLCEYPVLHFHYKCYTWIFHLTHSSRALILL